ncbi:MAG: rhodanese-like domain-containing protein [Xenococcaceae cyanobacterium MO_188.B32]|nr:rhodanese-like domain-containing protein [Xenococcaceae cyanobacterium MO_188.B32]
MNRPSNLIRYYSLLVSCFLLLTTVSCSKNYANHSEEWKQEKIKTLYTQYARKFPEVKDISAEELQQLQEQEKVILVDVRTPQEMEVSMIIGAISQAEFEREQDKYRHNTIVPYCTIGDRSGMYAKKLQEQGFQVFNFKGSILSWSHAGGKLVNSQGITNRVHIHGKKWELAAENYQAVW